MRALRDSVVMKRELSKKAKLSIFKTVFLLIITYGHESWVMTEKVLSQVQASEMRILRRIERVTLLNEVRSSEIRKSLNRELWRLKLKLLSSQPTRKSGQRRKKMLIVWINTEQFMLVRYRMYEHNILF